MATTEDIRSTLEDYLDEFDRAIGGDARLMERVLNGDTTLTTTDLGSTPESWTEDALINRLLDAAGLNKVPGRPSSQRETPDFRLDVEGAGEIVGENKAPNRIGVAEGELVEDYISKKSWSDYGIATDGHQWVVYRAEHGGDFINYIEVRRVDLRPALRDIAREKGYLGQQALGDPDADEAIQAFVDVFTPDRLVSLLTEEAPRQFRDLRKRNVEEFYELYIELLFGESDEYDGQYETCLREDIIAPAENTRKQNDVFAVSLVNRLLFIKFLETRDVIPEGFLLERVDDYNEGVPGTLYKTIIEPLFYDLFNTPMDERRPDHHHGWMADVPYLNGGLFRETIENEGEYDVLDRTLPTLITDLIEGTELDLDLDPAILGSVFEKTINHLSESENRQKEVGAYYTPNDVTRLVNEGAVDGKVRDVLVEAYTEELAHADEFRAEVEGMPLEEMLSRIEDGAGWFGQDAAMRKADEMVGNLKIVDPACGSGHFLTAAMEEVAQVQQSIYRGLHGGDDPSRKEEYELKKQLALNAIYGVDIDPVAAEIAKLRVWLKIVEENGWSEDFSQLPNIDINIVTGNSLIGLPEKSSGQASLSAFDLDLDEIQTVRTQYKEEAIGRQELNERISSLKPELREQYLSRLNHRFEQRIEDRETWEAITESLDTFYPEVQKVTVRRGNGEAFSDDQKTRLDRAGFNVEPRYGKSAKVVGSNIDDADVLGSLLDDRFILDVERQPTLFDLEEVEGGGELSAGAFHWIVEFPEAVVRNGNGYDVEFDIVVGNPPYGSVLSEAEKRIVSGYRTGSVDDIAAQFIERELQIIKGGGHFGNILTLKFVYQRRASEIRENIRENLTEAQIACFTRRPSQVFEGAQVRTGILTAQKSTDETTPIETSAFIRFDADDRSEVFRNIEYESTEELVLGERIGSGEDHALPKVGNPLHRAILLKLKERSNHTVEDERQEVETSHAVWRSRGVGYWVNPLMENLFEEGEEPTDFDPIFFDSELKQRTAFLLLQSSLFYTFWMTYGDERHLNWGSINAIPFPDEEDIRQRSDEIVQLSDRLWREMERRFVGENREMIRNSSELKPLIDEADELVGPMLGLSDKEVEYVKAYDSDYGRSTATDDGFDLEDALEVNYE